MCTFPFCWEDRRLPSHIINTPQCFLIHSLVQDRFHSLRGRSGSPLASCSKLSTILSFSAFWTSECYCDYLSVRLKKKQKTLFKVLNEQTFCFYFQVFAFAFCSLFCGSASALSFIPLLTCFILGRGWQGKICLISKSLFFCNCPFSGFPVLWKLSFVPLITSVCSRVGFCPLPIPHVGCRLSHLWEPHSGQVKLRLRDGWASWTVSLCFRQGRPEPACLAMGQCQVSQTLEWETSRAPFPVAARSPVASVLLSLPGNHDAYLKPFVRQALSGALPTQQWQACRVPALLGFAFPKELLTLLLCPGHCWRLFCPRPLDSLIL